MKQNNIKAELKTINNIDYLLFTPEGMDSLTMLPVITSGSRVKNNAWTWNGSLNAPTLKPSIRTVYSNSKGEDTEIHYWLTNGICHCLSDCKDGNSNKKLNLLDVESNN